MITFDNVSKRYPGGEHFAISNISLSVPSSKTLVFIGASGCGKTTLLKMANRLIEPTHGRILIDGEDAAKMEVRGLRQRIGYVAQMPTLFPHMTLAENIGLPLRITGISAPKIASRVNELMALTGLDEAGMNTRYPDEISGGQQQRACMARALATSPSILLLDEPFAALDAITRQQMQEEIKKIRKEMQVTILLVTHDVLEALYLGDVIAVLHQGSAEQVGTGEELLAAPATEYVRSLVTDSYTRRLGHG